jgi:hypothetical protein
MSKKNEKELYLIYVHKIGNNHKGDGLYEFIFSNDIDNAVGDGWFDKPANNNAEPPDEDYVDYVLSVELSDVDLSVLEESLNFSYIDGVDKVVSLAWETDEVGSGIENRLVFHYGDNKQSVVDKFYKRDITID